MIEKINARLIRVETYFIGACMLIMSCLALIQVIIRYVFFYSLVGLEECTRYLMIWMTFIGAGLAVAREDHIRIDIVPMLFKDKLNFDVQPIVNAVMLCFGIIFLHQSTLLLMDTIEYEQLSPAMRIPMALAYLCLFLSGLLIVFHAAVRLLMAYKNRKAGE